METNGTFYSRTQVRNGRLIDSSHMTRLEDLAKHLKSNMSRLGGDWVTRNSGYEAKFAEIVGAHQIDGKLWDCTWGELCIEVKKCKWHSWINLVPYAELVSSKDAEMGNLVTLFLFHRGKEQRIASFSLMTTSKLVGLLGLTKYNAPAVTKLNKEFGEGLNIQFRLGAAAIREKADFKYP